jgi:hypothetical protein
MTTRRNYCAICHKMGARILIAGGQRVHAPCRDGQDSKAAKAIGYRADALAHEQRIERILATIPRRTELRGPWPFALEGSHP